MSDRVLAANYGVHAVNTLLSDSCGCQVVGIRQNKIVNMDIEEAFAMPCKFNKDLYKIATILGQ